MKKNHMNEASKLVAVPIYVFSCMDYLLKFSRTVTGLMLLWMCIWRLDHWWGFTDVGSYKRSLESAADRRASPRKTALL